MTFQREISFNRKKLQLKLNSEADLSVLDEVFIDADYKILEPIIQKAQNCIIDIGAHIGFFSIYASLLNPDIQIFSFEPEPNNFQTLKENLKTNHIKNVIIKNLAIADEMGQKKLFISEDSHNHSLVFQTEKQLTIPATSLTKIFENISYCDLIKLDAEGAEFQILQSLPQNIFPKIKTFYIEYHEQLPEMNKLTLTRLLEMANYQIKIIPSNYQKNLGFILATLTNKEKNHY